MISRKTFAMYHVRKRLRNFLFVVPKNKLSGKECYLVMYIHVYVYRGECNYYNTQMSLENVVLLFYYEFQQQTTA